ncbi:MAG: DUF3552 domain-containing protein, partial [Caldilineaceae bacterium]|nr:DUF3552 domain-containing protein [Caldilineaceae bacterium]
VAGFFAYNRGRESGVEGEKRRMQELGQSAEERAHHILAEAETNIKQQQLALKEQEVQMHNEVESELSRRRKEIDRVESRLQDRQENIDKRFEQIENRERKLNQRQSRLDVKEKELDTVEEQFNAELERIGNMSQGEAQQVLLAQVEKHSRQEMARTIREVEAEVADEADRRAREIVTLAIERVASEHVSEYAVSTVSLPADEMKGRIIGRQGRNIRAIEQAIGVDLVVDDTPEAIIISSFDPVRREIARIALSKLVADGRIHPARIEKEVEKAQQEVEMVIREAGEQALIET